MTSKDEAPSAAVRGSELADLLAGPSLDTAPKRLIWQLSARALREYACKVRGERNTYRRLYEQHKAKAERLERELADARDACRRMAAELAG